MTKTPLEAAQAWYAGVHEGDFDKLFGVMSDDCTIEFYGPSVIPFAGIFRGKEKCKIFFGHVGNDVDIEEFRLYAADYAHILTIRDGQVVRLRDFQDSAQAAHVAFDLTTPER